MISSPAHSLCFHECSGVINALPLELVQILNIRLVVLGTRGDHNASRLDEPAVLQCKLVGPLVVLDLHDLLADHHLSAEFLCLQNRAAG
jgi:hypothetical protein